MEMKVVHEWGEADDPGKEVRVMGGQMEARQMVIPTGTTSSK